MMKINNGGRMQNIKAIVVAAGLGALALLSAMPSWAAESSLVATARNNVVVYTTGVTTLTLEPSPSILAGKYSTELTLANWNASTTVGTLAFRFNPTTMKSPVESTVTHGIATNKTNSAQTIPVKIVTHPEGTCTFSTSSTEGGWRVCDQGLMTAVGSIRLRGMGTTLSPGTYPLSMDAAIWAY